MKTAKALTEHLYRGKRRRVEDTYPIARADFPLMMKLGKIEIVTGEEPPKDYYIDNSFSYRTTAMEAPVKTKRKYTRKKVVE